MPFLNEPQGSLAVWQILSLVEAEPTVELASAVVVRHTAEKFCSQHRAVVPVCLASHAAANSRGARGARSHVHADPVRTGTFAPTGCAILQ